MDTIRARWNGSRNFSAYDSTGHDLVMDSSVAAGGGGQGWRPVELLLTALAGCTAMDVISILEKKRQDVRGIEIVVNGDPRMDEWPHFYQTIEVVYQVSGIGVDPDAVARAIELSEEKYCSVKGALGPQVTVTTRFEVTEAAE